VAYADVAELRTDLAGLANVFEIVTLEASWAFSRAVPDMCQVYGGAGRVYPMGTDWEKNPYLSPLRFAYGRPDRDAVTRQLIADAMSMASSGQLTVEASGSAPTVVTGKVEGLVAERAFVRLPGPFPGVVWPELVEPGLPAERLFAKRMRIQGMFDPETRRIDVHGMRRQAQEAIAGYHPGDTILVRVATVEEDSCTVEPFPGLSCTVPAELVDDERTDLRGLMTVGEVVPAWFGGQDQATGEWLLSLKEADDAVAAVPAPSILVGGPPWLVPVEPEPIAPEPAAVTVEREEDLVAEPTAAFVQALQRDKDQLVTQLKRAQVHAESLQVQLNSARTTLRETLRRTKKSSGPGPDDTRLFELDQDQLDFEIRLAWARTTLPSEKKSLPLKTWTYNAQFFDTLRDVQGLPREKLVEVLVQVLTGRDAELASRGRHVLRTGKGGDDPDVVRDRGEHCWRVSLQTKTPSARRLHYWTCADGSIELSSIRLHDDFRP